MSVKLSIIIPCYNSESTLETTLESVFNQYFQNWEAIIVNDGSTDTTEQIALRWVQKDKRFIYYAKQNEGLTKTRNLGISKSKGTYILPLDSDNQLMHDFTQDAITVFDKNPEIGVVYGDAEFFGLKKGLWKIEAYNFEKMLVDNYIDACAVYKKTLWERVGGYDENLPHEGLEDWELWLAFGSLNVNFYHLQKITFKYFVAENSMIRSFNAEMAMDTRDYMMKKYSKQYRYHFCKSVSEYRGLTEKIKGKKFAIDIFCKTFFGFSVFGKVKLLS
ncbi:glycosyltransferase [Flavobacterium sp. GB2R13]|uniref:glycosyltransferase n=1 Tax=Flavobacterium algoris TaxID=3398733 RepID=UPI003A84233A